MPFSATKLKKARGRISIKDAAFSIGYELGSPVTPQLLRAWENGTKPSADRLESIAAAYGIKMQDLFEPKNGRRK